MQSYPVLSFGGIHPFSAKDEMIAENVTVVGLIDVDRSALDCSMEIDHHANGSFAE